MRDFGLEDLLQQRDSIHERYFPGTREHPEDRKIQTAEKNATLFDFIKMIQKIVRLTMNDLDVEFIPDEGKSPVVDPTIPVDHPVITYKLISRKPKDELKPRFRQQITEATPDRTEARLGEVYGQKFKCILQFDIYASVYDTAEQVIERFEEMLFTYSGYFKKNGVAEIIMDEQVTDKNLDFYRQTMSIRSIKYYVEVEKLFVKLHHRIKEIETFSE